MKQAAKLKERCDKAYEEAVKRKKQWQSTFDSAEPMDEGLAADQYADWTDGRGQEEGGDKAVFLDSKEFRGSRRGYIFKTGTLGNGYYLDTAEGKKAIELHGHD